ncbi:SHOCT domain-containing protein [Bacillus subtilis]|uniref:SHOCT domain-containing protein n=1 Tax=Bacillus TaxID=1386 RepID=UPI0003A4C135|nr:MULTISPECIES: SHOCT domain-containing protein [Bacillus]MBS2762937.1 SHOCT domain-containing protein [Bacillus licheniformis]MCM2581672.1 SHOCT domain-containing protein [Bacillus stercoris]MEC1901912.1 SHOCT domain-containing protein [Bacillus atrophaeus]MEC2237526.1 SHOCT domain-containing protein [Bacillus subtilis]MEC2289341.1 SHOCT domain-containing protein [Bacillus licheniformis]
MMNGMMNGASMMGMCMMMFLSFLLLILITAVAVYVVVRFLMRNSRVTDRPLMLLKESYAKGEISEGQYEQRRKVLTKK